MARNFNRQVFRTEGLGRKDRRKLIVKIAVTASYYSKCDILPSAMSIEKPRFSLVVPTYNEALNILDFLHSTHRALGALGHEIIVVDDDSPDQTWKIAADFGRENPWARVIR